MSYHSPVCSKVSSAAMDLARHMIGRGDRVHRDCVNAKGFKFSELLTMQFRSYGGEGYRALAEVPEKETKVEDSPNSSAISGRIMGNGRYHANSNRTRLRRA